MVFEFYLGGYGRDNNFNIILRDKNLYISTYHSIPLPEHFKLIQTDCDNDWLYLISYLKSCRWNKRYDSEILDGTQWELKVKGNGININSYGSNSYPQEFDEFLGILNRLIKSTGYSIVK
ncbi:hypothetical protein [Pontibacter lucknowensis]|uniref:Uncharacterized protein n=1 Tax=Pontibacter lucknowensis TaxID=1077936 RepID=A0A1N7A0C7_9BACT|nr:hypothetical protein [Pontibacter lucknowensis]SIR32488.1 hypothetical protein SAMN05421545_3135 [Pontibacter lucknowensis]